MEHLSLLAGGQGGSHAPEGQPGREAWQKAAADALRKAGRMKDDDPDSLVWQKLTRTTLDGVDVVPLGTPETVADLPDPGLPGAAPHTRGTGVTSTAEGWDIRAHLADPDAKQAAEAALLDLENGVTSLWLTVGRGGIAPSDLPTVLDQVYLDLAPVVLECPEDPVGAAEAYVALLEHRGVDPAPGTNLGGEPIGAAVRAVDAGESAASTEQVSEVVTRLADLAGRHGVRALVVDGTVVNDLGATDAQELGYSLAVGAAYLRILTERAGLDVATAAGLVEFRYAVSDEQFTGIAKLRAARRLWHRVLELSGAQDAAGQVQHAVTARPMLTKYDPYVNMLRGTVAAFAGGVGGAAAVTVLPFDTAHGLPDALARRNARNTSSLLVHESHLAAVTDPAGGSFVVEKLTDDLAHAGWAQLQQVDADGGVLASLGAEDGLLARIHTQAVEPRQRQVATRRRAITGVSEFPHLEETLPERRPHPDGRPAVKRYAESFEALRDDPTDVPVFLATLGPIAQHTARATFAANLFAAGGVHSEVAGATASADDLVEAYRALETPTSVVCLAGSDAAYADWGADAARALREAGASYVVLAGKPGKKTVDPGLLDDSCAIGVDALAFLGRVREELTR